MTGGHFTPPGAKCPLGTDLIFYKNIIKLENSMNYDNFSTHLTFVSNKKIITQSLRAGNFPPLYLKLHGEYFYITLVIIE